MKRFLLAAILTLSYYFSFGQWAIVNAIDTFPRARPATFVIGDTAYLGNGDNAGFGYTHDFRAYTQNTNTWVEMRPYPGGGGDWGIRFQIGDTAYIGGGANPGWQNDFWRYDPKNGWKSLGTTPGGMRMGYNASFVIGNKGYVCAGDNSGSTINNVWEYDPLTNTFTPKAPFPAKRLGAAAFSANGYGYVGLGGDNTGTTYKDMYRYDPVADKWDAMASMPAVYGMEEPGFFVLCGKLFVTMGDSVQSGTSTSKQTWLFDPYNGPIGAWYRLPDYPGPVPSYAPAGFAMENTGYIYGGWNQPNWSDRGEMYSFNPTRVLMHMLAFPVDTTICSGNSVTLRGTSSLNYLWNTADTTANITVAPTQSTTYVVTETSGGCVFLDTINVTVNTGAALNILPAQPAVCSGQPITLTVSGASGSNLTWSPPTGLNVSTGDTVIASPDSTTTYTVSTGGGACSSNNTVVVTVGNTAVGGTISAVRDTLCAGTPGNLLLSNSSGKDIQWQSSDDDAIFVSVGDSLTTYKTTPLLQTTWYRALLGSGSCSAISDTFQLFVPPALQAYFYFIPSKDNYRQLIFNSDSSTGKIRAYHWDFGDGYTSTEQNPQHTFTADSTYYVCLTLYDGSNCSYTFCRYSEVSAPSGIANLSAAGSYIIFPNPFSDQLTISAKQTDNRIEGIELYDVLGRIVFNKTYETQANTILFDLSGLSQGMYYLHIKTADGNFFQPVIKQR